MEKLLALAAHLETTDKPYSQRMYEMCAMGHYFHEVAKRSFEYQHAVLMTAWGHDAVPPMVLNEFGLTEEQAHELFSSKGCGDAGNDKLKAATYIRDFVARNTVKHELAIAA